MKKLFVLSLTVCLVLLMSAVSMAAPHPFTGDFASENLMQDFGRFSLPFDGWYYIEKDDPSATVRGYFRDGGFALGGEYFKNDQTFIDVLYFDPDGGNSITGLKGSYLFENGIFAGLDYLSISSDSQTNLSLGYRLNVNDDAYVAFSLDYALDDNAYEDSGIIDYDIYGRYYTDNCRFYGQVIIPNEDVTDYNEAFFYVGGAYKVSDSVVIGANFMKEDNWDYFDLGATVSMDKLEWELQYADDNDAGSTLSGNVIYAFTDALRAGIQITDHEDLDDLDFDLKLAYNVDEINSLKLVYQLENDTYDSIIYLRWDIKL